MKLTYWNYLFDFVSKRHTLMKCQTILNENKKIVIFPLKLEDSRVLWNSRKIWSTQILFLCRAATSRKYQELLQKAPTMLFSRINVTR